LLALGVVLGSAQAQSPNQSGFPTIKFTQTVFTGGIFVAGDYSSFSGTLQARNPKCTLTVPSAPAAAGVGPNGSILLDGSSGCAGSYELFLSGGDSEYTLPTAGAMGGNTGVYSGTYAIISAKDQQTVDWAETYTQVYNITPTGFGCDGLTFCANLGPAFGNQTFNGFGLAFLLELNGFTWSVP
jgi:hypothetical protein